MDQKPKDPVNDPEFALDLTKLPKQQHNWVKRGIKISCEGAGHPHHSHFLTKQA